MKSFKKFFILVLCLTGFTQASLLQDSFAKEKVIIGLFDFPPFYVMPASGDNYSGTKLDLLKTILEKADYPYEVKGYPAKRMYGNLANGRTHLFMGIKGVPDYDKEVIYSSNPYSKIVLNIYTKNNIAKPAGKEDLIGKKILIIRGYSYGGLISYFENPENKIILDPATDHVMAFKKFQKGRADYLIDYLSPSSEVLKTISIPDIQVTQLFALDLYLIISKGYKDHVALMSDMEKAHAQLVAEGTVVP
jgi:ABC-type amino acid transport substrate-binding protein